jgi:rubrerythrin
MKIKVYLLLFVAIVTGILGLNLASAQKESNISARTQENLSIAMHGEAFAYAKYLLYAEHAQKHGHPELARLFEETAKVERFQHFAEEAALAGLVGSDADNLRDAIKGESYEVDTMYREFAEQAKTRSDPAAADRFEEVRRDELSHRDAFKTALAKVEKELTAKKQDIR